MVVMMMMMILLVVRIHIQLLILIVILCPSVCLERPPVLKSGTPGIRPMGSFQKGKVLG